MSDGVERSSEGYDEVPTIHAITDEQLRELLVDVSLAAYRSAKYRGQFNGEQVDHLGQKIIERQANDWYEQNKDEYL